MQARLDASQLISPGDLKLLSVTDDVDEVVQMIRDYERRVGPARSMPAFA
jgi:uncharacterized protein YlzI (FlbEa/FlbD family)